MIEMSLEPWFEAVREGARALAEGHLVAFPTETVYGLGADATNSSAVARVFEAKGRPVGHPLIIHVGSAEALDRWAIDIPEYARDLAFSAFPGPLTLILKKSEAVSSLVTGGQDTVGLRAPAHPVAQALIAEFERAGGSGAIAAPSANRFGRVSPTSSEAVRAELSDHLRPGDLIIDGGDSQIGVESTIVDCTADCPSIARPGAITTDMVRSITGLDPVPFSNQIRVSGSLKSHYAPAARVVLEGDVEPGDGFIALSHHPTPRGAIRLLDAPTPEHFARGLYRALRRADALGLNRVVAISPEGQGIGVAIRDRLERASHGSTSRSLGEEG